jgi:hypothetical protein
VCRLRRCSSKRRLARPPRFAVKPDPRRGACKSPRSNVLRQEPCSLCFHNKLVRPPSPTASTATCCTRTREREVDRGVRESPSTSVTVGFSPTEVRRRSPPREMGHRAPLSVVHRERRWSYRPPPRHHPVGRRRATRRVVPRDTTENRPGCTDRNVSQGSIPGSSDTVAQRSTRTAADRIEGQMRRHA